MDDAQPAEPERFPEGLYEIVGPGKFKSGSGDHFYSISNKTLAFDKNFRNVLGTKNLRDF
jgi:hypothetical protein